MRLNRRKESQDWHSTGTLPARIRPIFRIHPLGKANCAGGSTAFKTEAIPRAPQKTDRRRGHTFLSRHHPLYSAALSSRHLRADWNARKFLIGNQCTGAPMASTSVSAKIRDRIQSRRCPNSRPFLTSTPQRNRRRTHRKTTW